VAISNPASVFPEPGTPVINIKDLYLLILALLMAVKVPEAILSKLIAPDSDRVISLTECPANNSSAACIMVGVVYSQRIPNH